MTTLTRSSEASAVNVVFEVARAALRTLLQRSFRRLKMALGARQTFVLTIEWKPGLIIVIENPQLPVVWVVATIAVRTQSSAMGIIACMAIYALTFNGTKLARRVAGVTACDSVNPH